MKMKVGKFLTALFWMACFVYMKVTQGKDFVIAVSQSEAFKKAVNDDRMVTTVLFYSTLFEPDVSHPYKVRVAGLEDMSWRKELHNRMVLQGYAITEILYKGKWIMICQIPNSQLL